MDLARLSFLVRRKAIQYDLQNPRVSIDMIAQTIEAPRDRIRGNPITADPPYCGRSSEGGCEGPDLWVYRRRAADRCILPPQSTSPVTPFSAHTELLGTIWCHKPKVSDIGREVGLG
jgi:hypothetical protein